MKIRKRILLLIGAIQIFLGFNFSISHPRATSSIEAFESELIKENKEIIDLYATDALADEKGIRKQMFQHTLEPLIYTAHSLRKTKSKAADTLFFSGILVFAAALSIRTKPKREQDGTGQPM
jgi:hypothetical protein